MMEQDTASTQPQLECERASVTARWEEFYNTGRRIGGYPVSALVERWFLEHPRFRSPVLEIGCGTGRSYSHLVNLLGSRGTAGLDLVGLDTSQSALAKAASRQGFAGVMGDMFNIPFCSSSFGFIYSRNVLLGYSRRSMSRLAAEVDRVLGKGGVLAVEERGPLDRVPAGEMNKLDRAGRFLGRDIVCDIFDGLELLAWSEDIRKRVTAFGTVVVHASAAILRKC